MKKENTIALNGKKWKVGFDFSTLLAFEEIAGHSLETLSEISKKDNVILLYASILTFNDDVPEFNDWLHCINNYQVYQELNNLVAPHVIKFFSIPTTAELPKKGKDTKNA